MNSKLGETPLLRIIDDINSNVRPFFENHFNFDVLGQFYGEFLRYTGGDGKGLGIVLTPNHITQLFAKLANLTPKSIVLDTCAGTSGFLISAMYEMIRKAKNQAEIDYIKQNCLLGVEQQPNMFALAASNMILRGDGKANLFQGDCFDEKIVAEISGKADVGMINPPYSQKGEDLHELDFVYNLLNCLKPNSVGIAIVPMSCAISPNPLREKLLEKNRLDAVMSMPDDLFYPIGVVPCIMVFTAHVPHEQNQYHETWFGYWKNDGFIKTKHKGRIDGGTWEETQERWLDAYFKRSEIAGFSVKRKVTDSDEWCAEAYMETSYEDLSEATFKENVLRFLSFSILRESFEYIDFFVKKSITKTSELKTDNWQWFTYDEIFDLKKGQRIVNNEMIKGNTPCIRPIDDNNGVHDYIDLEPNHTGNTITVNYNGSVAEAFYQPKPYFALDDINVLYPKFELNPYIAMFLTTLIRKEKYRFSYGRKWHLGRMKESKIKLPIDANGKPDWKFMEDYIKSLPYSANL